MQAEIAGNKIKLYGTLWEGDGAGIARKIEQVDGSFEQLNVHLHTSGGSVFDGNLIYNALTGAKSRIHMYIDGMAASMGSIIMLAGEKIFMAENAYIMIHAPKGSVWGTAKDMRSAAKVLESMEANFMKKYAQKVKQGAKKVESWLDGDHWFSAEQALSEGLIDTVVEPRLEDHDIQGLKSMKIAAMLAENPSEQKEALKSNQRKVKGQSIIKSTMKQEIIGALALEGLTAESSDTAIVTAAATKLKNLEAALESKNAKIQALEEKETRQREQAIETAVNTAISEGKITAAQKETYTGIGATAGLESLQKVFADMKAHTPLAQMVGRMGTAITRNATVKDWDTYQKEDPRGLETLKNRKPRRIQ